MKRYLIYCAAGTGGLFLSTVFAQFLGRDIKARFSASGHAHDMGQGNWKGHDSICFIGNYWELNYRPHFPLYYSHVMPDNFLSKNPDIELVFITAKESDYRKIAELYVKKAWPDLWTEEEYKIWASPDYPPYSPNNILESELICQDLINDLQSTYISAWFETNCSLRKDHEIDFRTVMGVDEKNLAECVSNIVGKTSSGEIQQYIKSYQDRNRDLYFKDYILC